MGRDGGSLATDSMLIVHVPADGSKATLISLPRDSYVAIPGYGMNRLNAAYAEAFTRSRHEHKGLGSRAIAFELRRRSVPDELVQEAVSVLDTEQEQRTASRLPVEPSTPVTITGLAGAVTGLSRRYPAAADHAGAA